MTYLLIPQNNTQETLNSVFAVSNALTFMGNFVMIKNNPMQNFASLKFDQIIEISGKQNFTSQNVPAFQPNRVGQQMPLTQPNVSYPQPTIPQNIAPQTNAPKPATQNPVPQNLNTQINPMQNIPQNSFPQIKTPENFLSPAITELIPRNHEDSVNNSRDFSPSPKLK